MDVTPEKGARPKGAVTHPGAAASIVRYSIPLHGTSYELVMCRLEAAEVTKLSIPVGSDDTQSSPLFKFLILKTQHAAQRSTFNTTTDRNRA